MKKLVFIITLVAAMYGCNKEMHIDRHCDDLVAVRLSLTGEVSIKYEPLTKSVTSNDLVGIQVYQEGKPYAYGLFDSMENMLVYLHSGVGYSLRCTYIKNGKETLKMFDDSDRTQSTWLVSNPVGNQLPYHFYKNWLSGPNVARFNSVFYDYHISNYGYGEPFDIKDHYIPNDYNNYPNRAWVADKCMMSTSASYGIYPCCYEGAILNIYPSRSICPITNSFVYDSVGMDLTQSSVAAENGANKVDRYHGAIPKFTALLNEEHSLEIPMKHIVYGFQCNVTGVTDGSVSIKVTNGDNTLIDKNGITGEFHSEEQWFACSNLLGAWQYGNNYTENVTVSMTWLRGVGVQQDLGSQVVQVKRNCMNTITVCLSTTQQSSAFSIDNKSSDTIQYD